MHRPELPLGGGGARRDRGRPRLGVKGQRQIAPDEPDLVGVLVAQAPERLLGARAERALEVGELDDGDLRRRPPGDGRAVERDAITLDRSIGQRRSRDRRERLRRSVARGEQ